MEESAFFNKLRSAGNAAITILAPSDEAFQKIPASRLDAIMKDKEARLGIHLFQIPFTDKDRIMPIYRYDMCTNSFHLN